MGDGVGDGVGGLVDGCDDGSVDGCEVLGDALGEVVGEVVQISPGELENILVLLASEVYQSPQSTWLKAVASLNMLCMVVTWPTFHWEMSWLKVRQT